MIVPYTPGGSIDTVGRLVADEMQKILGQSFVVDNKPGASGMIGANEAARAPADGYTLLFNASSQVYMPLVVAKKTYDAEKDFTPIAQVGYVPWRWWSGRTCRRAASPSSLRWPGPSPRSTPGPPRASEPRAT